MAHFQCAVEVLSSYSRKDYCGEVVITMKTGDLNFVSELDSPMSPEPVGFTIKEETAARGRAVFRSCTSTSGDDKFDALLTLGSTGRAGSKRSNSMAGMGLPRSEVLPSVNPGLMKGSERKWSRSSSVPEVDPDQGLEHKKRDHKLMLALARESAASGVSSVWLPAIQRDVMRTFFLEDNHHANVANSLKKTKKVHSDLIDNVERIKLRHLLEFMALAYPQIGYCQGMHMIGKFFLSMWSFRPDSQVDNAFLLFARMMEDRTYRLGQLFSPGFAFLNHLLEVFQSKLHRVEPLTHARLSELGVEPMLYATKWFLTLFTYYLEVDTAAVATLWMKFLAQGWNAVVNVGVTCVCVVKELLINAEFEEALQVLTGNHQGKVQLLSLVFRSTRGVALLEQIDRLDDEDEARRAWSVLLEHAPPSKEKEPSIGAQISPSNFFVTQTLEGATSNPSLG